MSHKTKAVILVLICVSLWALIPVVAKLGQSDLDNHQFLFWSSLTSFIAMLIFIFLNKKTQHFKNYSIKDWLMAIALGFLGTYLYYILLYFGYANALGLEVLILQYSWPILIVILSLIILKEKLNLYRITAIIVGFIGIILVLTKGDLSKIYLDNYFIDLIILFGALSFALFSVLSKKIKLEEYSLITIYFLTATIFSFFSMIAISKFSWPSTKSIIPILLNGILINGYSYIFWLKSLKNAQASFIAPFIFLTPVISAVYLVIFFNEKFLPIYAIGLFFVIIAGWLNK